MTTLVPPCMGLPVRCAGSCRVSTQIVPTTCRSIDGFRLLVSRCHVPFAEEESRAEVDFGVFLFLDPQLAARDT